MVFTLFASSQIIDRPFSLCNFSGRLLFLQVLTGVFGSSTLAKDLIAKAAVKGTAGKSKSSSSGSSKKKAKLEAPKNLNIARAVTVTETAKYAGQTVT